MKLTLFGLTLLSLIVFQNCSNSTKSTSEISPSWEVNPTSVPPQLLGTFQLAPGQSINRYSLSLVYQSDGNLVLYRTSSGQENRSIWSSETSGQSCHAGNCHANFQADGNLVLYKNNVPYWQSSTALHPNAKLRLMTRAPHISIIADQGVVWFGLTGMNWLTSMDPFGNYGSDRPGMPDFMNLFRNPQAWTLALKNTHVLKFYTQTISSASDTVLVEIFKFLKSNDISLAIEFPVVNRRPDCGMGIEGMGDQAFSRAFVDRVKRLGGEIDWIAMDEPVYYGHYLTSTNPAPANSCLFSLHDLATNVASTFQIFRAQFPNVIMGDIEPFVAVPSQAWLSDYKSFLDQYKIATNGVPIGFVHDDGVPENPTWISRVLELKAVLNRKKIARGFIRNGNASVSQNGSEWIASALARIKYHQNYDNDLTVMNIIQSWDSYPAKLLPSSDPSALTYLLKYYADSAQSFGAFQGVTPVYRFANNTIGNYVFSANPNEPLSLEYRNEGVSFRVIARSFPGSIPLYRCFASSDASYFLSNDTACEGQEGLGLLGYLSYAASREAATPIFRCLRNRTHLVTGSPEECLMSNFKVEGILGFSP